MKIEKNLLRVVLDRADIRKVQHGEDWYYSVVDIIAILLGLDSKSAKNYYYSLKKRLEREGNENIITQPQQLKLAAADGKKYMTEVVDVEQIIRIIQSISSPEVEPVKRWLAVIGKEKLLE